MFLYATGEHDYTSRTASVPPLISALHATIRRCIDVVPGASGCGLSLLTTDGRRITSVATDRVAERLKALLDLHDENPCATAWLRGATLWTDMPAADGGWDNWQADVRALGVKSVLTVSLADNTRQLGVLILYSTAGSALRPADATALDTVAAQSAAEIAACQSPARAAA